MSSLQYKSLFLNTALGPPLWFIENKDSKTHHQTDIESCGFVSCFNKKI